MQRHVGHIAGRMLLGATFALASGCVSAAVPASLSRDHGPVVATLSGRVQGTATGSLDVYKGIPYAAPPTGALRWRPPAPVKVWTGIRAAQQFGPACYQPKPKGISIYDLALPMSEDCLTLNVWSPKDARNAPIFFWIHGGALWNGSSRDPMLDGARLAERGIIVVSVNYRLGPLGWLALPALSAESPDGVSGNYGLLDQIAALKWVRANIHNFGGDPKNVTIAGVSAGALSVMALMTSPEAKGLFAKAIAESSYMWSMPELKENKYGMPSAESIGTKFEAAVHATDLAALRAMDPEKLTEAGMATGFAPWVTVDGRVVPHQFVAVFDKGEQAHVPLIAGFNSGETSSLPYLLPKAPADAAAYDKVIRDRYGDLAAEYLRLYPPGQMRQSIADAMRNAVFGWTAEKMVRAQTRAGQPAYLYFFDHGYPSADALHLHAFHASEVPFVFGTFDGTPPRWPKVPDTQAQRRLSDAMMGYWTSFARSGKSTAEGEPAWPVYRDDNAYMAFTDTAVPSHDLLPGMFGLVDEVVCRRLASGNEAWNWNFGLASPPLPPKSPACVEHEGSARP